MTVAVTLHTTKGRLSIGKFDQAGLLDLIEELNTATGFLHFELDDGKSASYVNPAHVIRVDVEFNSEEQ